MLNEVLCEVGKYGVDLQLFDLILYGLGNIILTNDERIRKISMTYLKLIPSKCNEVVQAYSGKMSLSIGKNFVWTINSWLG
jgi:hypothetical protein